MSDLAYTKVINKKTGKPMYYHNGKLVKREEYEANAVPEVKEKPTVDELAKAAESRKCLFCGGPAKRTKWVNMEVVKLCDEHYYERTTGEVAEQMRKVAEHATSKG